MAQSYRIVVTCEICGAVEVPNERDELKIGKESAAKGWVFLLCADGWRHFCQLCSLELSKSIASIRRPEQARISAPVTPSDQSDVKQQYIGRREKSWLRYQEKLLAYFDDQKVDQEEVRQYKNHVLHKVWSLERGCWAVLKSTHVRFRKYGLLNNEQALLEEVAKLDEQLRSAIRRDKSHSHKEKRQA